MKVLKYSVIFSESILDLTRGSSKIISEFFVPERKIAFSFIDGLLYVFRLSQPRVGEESSVKILDLDNELIEKIAVFLKLREEIEEKRKELKLK